MTTSNKKQPIDKKPIGKNHLWREIPENLQGKVRGGYFDESDGQ